MAKRKSKDKWTLIDVIRVIIAYPIIAVIAVACFIWYSLPDYYTMPKIRDETYDSLQIGMSYDQVIGMIGHKGEIIYTSQENGQSTFEIDYAKKMTLNNIFYVPYRARLVFTNDVLSYMETNYIENKDYRGVRS